MRWMVVRPGQIRAVSIKNDMPCSSVTMASSSSAHEERHDGECVCPHYWNTPDTHSHNGRHVPFAGCRCRRCWDKFTMMCNSRHCRGGDVAWRTPRRPRSHAPTLQECEAAHALALSKYHEQSESWTQEHESAPQNGPGHLRPCSYCNKITYAGSGRCVIESCPRNQGIRFQHGKKRW